MNNNTIKNLLSNYLTTFPQETGTYTALTEQLETDTESLLRRDNMKGHVTASGVVIKDNTILLIFHNKLEKYIQPGGHLEDDATVWQGAQREVKEETGLSVTLHPWHEKHNTIPINIDTHTIPANAKKQEGEHFHHDFVYVFTPIDDTITLQEIEVSDFKWVPITETFDNRSLRDSVKKLPMILK